MEPSDVEQRLKLLEKQVEAAVSLFQDTKLDLLSGYDSLKIEIETLKRYLQNLHPDFQARYQELREEVVRSMDPEWAERETRKADK
jgi:hypothetical protein